MRLLQVRTIASVGPYHDSELRRRAEEDLIAGIHSVRWPAGADRFTIPPMKHGNGVPPIKNGFVETLGYRGWKAQQKYPRLPEDAEEEVYPGAFDGWLDSSEPGPVVAEWETGNISSSHRSVNRIARALMEGRAAAGYLVLPSRTLYDYLTDRIGNFREVQPYFTLWERLLFRSGHFAIIEVEHDELDLNVEAIPKGKDGNARRLVASASANAVERSQRFFRETPSRRRERRRRGVI